MPNFIIDTMFSWMSWGKSDDIFTWIPWSFQESRNIEIRANPRVISLTKKLVKDSWSIVTDLINCFVWLSTGDFMAFWDTWEIYRKYSWSWHKNSSSIWSSILSAIEYNWYLYFTTQASLYRVALWSINDSMTFTPYKTFARGSIYHPMIVYSNTNLYIGDKDYISLIDYAWVWYEDILVLSKNLVCKSIQAISWSIKFYCEYSTSLNSSEIIYWSWVEWVLPSESITINGVNPNHIINMNGYDYVIANKRLWILDWFKQQKLKDITDFSLKQNSIWIIDNKIAFGWTGWIWIWWALNKNYPEVLSFDFSSSNASDDIIWALGFFGWEFYSSWKNWSSYWIDKLTTWYNTSWSLTTRVYFWNTRYSRKKLNMLFVSHKELLAWESIKIYMRRDFWSFELIKTYTTSSVVDSKYRDNVNINWEFNFIEFKFELLWTGSTTPELYEVFLKYDENNPI